MAFIEKLQKATEPKHWLGDMEADHYIYSAGVAGERFFTALRDEGKILGARCQRCSVTYVPPRIYCEGCFAELKDYREMGLKGQVASFTVVRLDKEGKKLNTPEVFALIQLGPDATGLLHKLGEIGPEEVRIGMEVEAVLKPKGEREGRITDIEYFRPLAR
jgi:hypothetical protein